MSEFLFMNHKTHSKLQRERISTRSDVRARADGRAPTYWQVDGRLVITVPFLSDDEMTTELTDKNREWIVSTFSNRGWDVPACIKD